MKLVIIESPFGTKPDGSRCSAAEMAENIRYLNACILDCLRRDELPYASHGFFPAVLNDANPEERHAGIEAGLAWGFAAAVAAQASRKGHLAPGYEVEAYAVAYLDRGTTDGMRKGFSRHKINGLEIVERYLGGEWVQ
jgi:hypothetical protein